MSRRDTVGLAGFRVTYVLLATFMMFPLLVVVSTSFTGSGHLSFPPEEFTLEWYGTFLEDERWLNAFKNSILIAVGATVVSTALGVMAAFGMQGLGKQRRNVLIPVILVPMLVPTVVLGVTLLMYLSKFGMQQTYVGVILAHSLWSTPMVFFIMQAVLTRFDWNLTDAAADLGATPFRSFVEVVLPGIKHGILASALIAFILSLQEFIVALFLTGYDTVTVPVLAWNALRDMVNPLVSVVSTLLILAVVILLVPVALTYGFERLARRL